MKTPEEVALMRQLLVRGWSRWRIATELGSSRPTVSRYQLLGEWQRYGKAHLARQLDGLREWLWQQFESNSPSSTTATPRWCNRYC
jgi:hypothetical protein